MVYSSLLSRKPIYSVSDVPRTWEEMSGRPSLAPPPSGYTHSSSIPLVDGSVGTNMWSPVILSVILLRELENRKNYIGLDEFCEETL